MATTTKKTTTAKPKAPAKKKATPRGWTKTTFNQAIKTWLKELETPINKAEIDFENSKPEEKRKWIKPKLPHPTVASFYKHVSRNTIKTWQTGNETQQELYMIFEDKVRDYVRAYTEQKILDNNSGAIYYSKAVFGYREYKNSDDKPIIINLQLENKGDNKL